MTEHRTLIETGWNFDNSYAKLPESFYSKLSPTPVSSPELIILNERLAAELGLNPKALQSEEGIATLAGNYVPDHALPLAQAYAGHQFGHFTMLGDGRAVLLGEQITPDNDRFDIQFKGSGPTPYSRRGDGRAVLGPMLREYIVSEAMAALGIPTTLSLAVVATGEPVYRETEQSGAILTRVAASHIRVGTFQYAAGAGSVEDLRALADYTWERHFSAADADGNRYLQLLEEVIKGQAELIAKWQLVGFIHGVMNTDNMALSGETIDYGPCAFMDAYDPSMVFSSIDRQGRYAYQNQPPIALWNLTRLAETLLPLLADDKDQQIQIAEDALADFKDLYQQHWLAGMRAKLGIHNAEAQDDQLFQELLHLMHKYNADYTNTFVALTFEETPNSDLFSSTEFQQWQTAWQARLGRQPQTKEASQQLMRDSNPAVIPRNYRVEEALKAAELEGDYSVMQRLLKVLAKPYAHDPDQEEYATLPKSTQPYRTYCGT